MNITEIIKDFLIGILLADIFPKLSFKKPLRFVIGLLVMACMALPYLFIKAFGAKEAEKNYLFALLIIFLAVVFRQVCNHYQKQQRKKLKLLRLINS